MNPSTTYSSSFFNTQSTLWSLPSQPNLKSNKIRLRFSKSQRTIAPISNDIITDFSKHYLKQRNQLSLMNRYKKIPRHQTLMQFYTQSHNDMKNFTNLFNYKNKAGTSNEKQNEVLFQFYTKENDFEKKKHQNYWSDNDDDDNEKKMFLKTNGLKIKIPHSKKEELKRQSNLNLFKYTGGINVKNLEYKDKLSSYKNIFVNQQIERKIFMNTTEKQISKYLNENNKNLSHQIKSKLMPNIKIINSNNRKILLIKEKNSDKIINGTNFNIIFNRK